MREGLAVENRSFPEARFTQLPLTSQNSRFPEPATGWSAAVCGARHDVQVVPASGACTDRPQLRASRYQDSSQASTWSHSSGWHSSMAVWSIVVLPGQRSKLTMSVGPVTHLVRA